MQPEEPNLSKPEYWLSKSPDRMVLTLISTVIHYWQLINTVLYILKNDANTKTIVLQNGTSLSSFLEKIENEHKVLRSNLDAATEWIDAYRKGKIDLEPYRSPYASDDKEDKKES